MLCSFYLRAGVVYYTIYDYAIRRPNMSRPTWDEYFMEMAELARTRTTCLRRGVGAVIVKDNRVLATGYNGSPKGVSHCSETGCLR